MSHESLSLSHTINSTHSRNEDAITTDTDELHRTQFTHRMQIITFKWAANRKRIFKSIWLFRLVFGSINEFCPISDGKLYKSCFCVVVVFFFFDFFSSNFYSNKLIFFLSISLRFILTLDTRFCWSCGCSCCCCFHHRRRRHQSLTMFTKYKYMHTLYTLGKNFSNRKCFYFVEFVAAAAAVFVSWLCSV